MNTRIDYPFIVLTKRKLIEKGKTKKKKKKHEEKHLTGSNLGPCQTSMLKFFWENNISKKFPSTIFGREIKTPLSDNILSKCEFPDVDALDKKI